MVHFHWYDWERREKKCLSIIACSPHWNCLFSKVKYIKTSHNKKHWQALPSQMHRCDIKVMTIVKSYSAHKYRLPSVLETQKNRNALFFPLRKYKHMLQFQLNLIALLKGTLYRMLFKAKKEKQVKTLNYFKCNGYLKIQNISM